MVRAIRSYIASLKASAGHGRAMRLEKAGRKAEALAMIRGVLAQLSAPWIVRDHFAVSSVLITSTVMAECIGESLSQPGAGPKDMLDSLRVLRQLPPGTRIQDDDPSVWIQYLESRLARYYSQGNGAV